MNIRGQVQGFAIGAAVTAAIMIGGPQLLSAHPAETDATKIAAAFNVKIVWTTLSPCSAIRENIDGCFSPKTPATIYVSPTLNPANEYYIVLHEIGHVLQHRLGVVEDECAADRFAQSMRSTLGYYCKPIPDATTY